MSDRQLIRDVLLRDGSTLRLRAPTPEDFEDIKRFFEQLSEESRYMRFHGFGRIDLAARHYAEADGADRVALIGRSEDRVVASAGYDRLREPGAAEVAFAVADDFHGRGAATRLLEQLAAIAAERGIRRFDAEVLAENRAMLGVFRAAGFGLRRAGASGEVTVSLDLTPTAALLERIDERDHAAVVASLRALLAPGSVAVIGAAPEPGNVGEQVLARLIEAGFRGVVTPVNADGSIVRSIRATRTVAEIAELPDLAIIATPSARVLDAAAEAAEAGCRAVLVLGEDPHEDRPPGAYHRLLELVRAAGMRMVGPNSLGLLNSDPAVSLQATASPSGLLAGQLAVCSQSGAIGIGLLGQAAARRLGISAFVSLGDRVDVSTNDLLEFWEDDDRTAAVMLYVETFGNPERFARIARRASRRKPILAVKGHRMTQERPPQARSHTAAALRGDAAVDALLRHAGVMRFRGGEELFNAAEFFESQPLPAGRRVGILTNSAGVATLAQDACATRGLVVGEVGRPVEGFGDRAQAPGQAGRRSANPLVLGRGAGPEDYGEAMRELLLDPDVDAVMVFHVSASGGVPNQLLDRIADSRTGVRKPVVASIVGADGRLAARTAGVPNFLFPEACAAVLARGAERREWLSRPIGQLSEFDDLDAGAARALVAAQLPELGEGGGWLPTDLAEQLLATHGLPVIPSLPCASVEDAIASAGEVGGPIALKADFEPPAHAGDIDAVLLGLDGEPAVRAGWRELERRVRAGGRQWQGARLQPLVAPGADVLVGAVRDPELGALMAIGLGGRQAGLASDAAFRLLPVTDVDADELLTASQGVAAQLAGFRGQPPLDHEALRELVLRFAALLAEVPEILEADLNPTRAMDQGCAVLDVRVRIGRHQPADRVKTW